MNCQDSQSLSYEYLSVVSSDEDGPVNDKAGDNVMEEIFEQDGKYDPDFIDKEDIKLVNWNKWMNVRVGQQEWLSSRLKREPNDLVMNSTDFLERIPNDNLIEYARTFTTFDKYRGDPKFWRTPNYIYDGKEKTEPLNCPVNEKFDRTVINENQPPTVERFGLSRLIKTEMVPRQVMKPKTTVHKCDYFNERKLQLKKNIKLIEPYTPDLEHLYIAGIPCLPTDEETIKHVEEEPLDIQFIIECPGLEKTDYNVDTRFPILKIQNTIISKDIMNNLDSDVIHTIEFNNCSINELYTKVLTIENIGNICVRYLWEKEEICMNEMFPLRRSTQLTKRFVFPNEYNISVPGQITEIPFSFRSRESGTYHETWELITDPVFSKKVSIKVALQSFVGCEIDKSKIDEFESYISTCKLKSASLKLVDEVIGDSNLEKTVPYGSLFSIKDLFLHNNVHHFYDYDKVEILKELYKKVSGEKEWDLSIKTLRGNILSNVDEVTTKRENLQLLYDITRSLLKPNAATDMNNEKYQCVYQILCSFVNLMENESVQLRSVYKLREFEINRVSMQTSQNLIKDKRLSSKSASVNAQNVTKNSSLVSLPVSLKSTETGASSLDSRSNQNSMMSGSTKVDISQDRYHQYIKSFSIKTYQYLLTAVDEVTAIIESINLFNKPK